VTVGSLFAGIGGFDLGFERAGFEIAWQVEIDPFCHAVLERHWPDDVMRYRDVRSVHYHDSCWEDGCGQCLSPVDVVCAGFPCQPVCHHGRREGQNDERWLWPEVLRIVGEMEPGYVVLENVPGLLYPGRGFAQILADLASLGFDAEWECLPAIAFGASHYRERIWLVAYRPDERCDDGPSPRLYIQRPCRHDIDGCGPFTPRRNAGASAWHAYIKSNGPEPGILRAPYGLSGGVDRVFAIGNAIVPQIAEWIARQILAAEGR